jgi:hypothetical protein
MNQAIASMGSIAVNINAISRERRLLNTRFTLSSMPRQTGGQVRKTVPRPVSARANATPGIDFQPRFMLTHIS